jgi:hypothetical protein
MIRQNNIIFANVPIASTLHHALTQQGWEEHGRADGYSVMSKPFDNNRDRCEQLDRFAEQKITAWAGR